MEILDKEYIWIENHPEQWWSIGQIIGSDPSNSKFIVKSIDDESEYSIEKSKAVKANLNWLQGLPNLLALDELNEGTLLTTIRKRYNESQIYTSIGSSILVSLNPYMKLPIYTVDKALECRNYVK